MHLLSSYAEAYIGGSQCRPAQAKMQDTIQKITKAKREGECGSRIWFA
jgi:hypothetical protein